jgi:hypothetical protein
LPSIESEWGETVRELARNVGVTLLGAAVSFGIGTILFQEQKPNAPLGLFSMFILIVTFFYVGYFATRLQALQSGLAYLAGSIMDSIINYAPLDNPHTHSWPIPILLKVMRGALVLTAVACVLGFLGAWTRKRMNKRLSRNRDEAV